MKRPQNWNQPCPNRDCPDYGVPEVIGYLKGKSAIAVVRRFSGKPKTI